jgi:hypothetical protein
MAPRAITIALGVAALVLLPIRPLVALVVFCVALALLMDRRGLFGHGRFRMVLAFFSGLWLGVLGVVTAFLGSVPPPDGNFLLLPGLLILGLGAVLLVWSFVRLLGMPRG